MRVAIWQEKNLRVIIFGLLVILMILLASYVGYIAADQDRFDSVGDVPSIYCYEDCRFSQ